MMIARRLRPLGWAAAVGVAAISFYLVSLRVAAERGDLESIDRQIAQTHRDIRQLQTELRTRASMRQLERWNGEVLALSAPSASQYLDETQLGSVDALPGDGGPLNIPQTVQVAVIAPEDGPVLAALPAPAPSSPVPSSPAISGIVSPAQAATAERTTASTQTGDVDSKRRQRVAMLEKKLLDDHTLGELGKAAAREATKPAGRSDTKPGAKADAKAEPKRGARKEAAKAR